MASLVASSHPTRRKPRTVWQLVRTHHQFQCSESSVPRFVPSPTQSRLVQLSLTCFAVSVVLIGCAPPAGSQAVGDARCTSSGNVEVFYCTGPRWLPRCNWVPEPRLTCESLDAVPSNKPHAVSKAIPEPRLPLPQTEPKAIKPVPQSPAKKS